MEWHLPMLPFDLHPLIGEAKRRARRRRLLVGVLVLAAAGAAAAAFAAESGGGSAFLCASVPSGWQSRNVQPGPAPSAPQLVLTNFRFGNFSYLDGLFTPGLPWPASGVMIAVIRDGASDRVSASSRLRVRPSDFGPFEGAGLPFADVRATVGGRVVDAYVEVAKLTPATVAAANDALAGVHGCSA